MDLILPLKNLGFNEKEAKVYFTLLQSSKTSANTVAKNSGLKKSTTYVILEDLIKKGVVNRVPHVKIMQYRPISPENLFSEIETRMENVEKEILPELKALSRSKEHEVKITYCEGLSGIKEIYKKMLREAAGTESVAFYGHQKDVPDTLRGYWRELNPEFKNHNITRRIIISEHPTIKYYLEEEEIKKNVITIKALPINKYNSNISIEIYLNYTFIFSHRFFQGVLINNQDVAKTMKQIFELIWERKDFLSDKK